MMNWLLFYKIGTVVMFVNLCTQLFLLSIISGFIVLFRTDQEYLLGIMSAASINLIMFLFIGRFFILNKYWIPTIGVLINAVLYFYILFEYYQLLFWKITLAEYQIVYYLYECFGIIVALTILFSKARENKWLKIHSVLYLILTSLILGLSLFINPNDRSYILSTLILAVLGSFLPVLYFLMFHTELKKIKLSSEDLLDD